MTLEIHDTPIELQIGINQFQNRINKFQSESSQLKKKSNWEYSYLNFESHFEMNQLQWEIN